MNYKGHERVSIDNVYPEIDCGKYAIKRAVGEPIKVEADIFADGHDKVDALLLFRKKRKGGGRDKKWNEKPMVFENNDHWHCHFDINEIGDFEYSIAAWIDHFSTWQTGLKKKFEANQNIKVELLIGAEMMKDASERANPTDRKQLTSWIDTLESDNNEKEAVSLALSDEVSALMYRNRDREKITLYDKVLPLRVERKRAAFSAWYEFFPRSTSPVKGQHGTFQDCENILPEVAKMGFDVIYLPPIHPIGRSHRKGINNATEAQPEDVGSPWAIGAKEGGHKAIHPQLGSLEDFQNLVKKAKALEMEIALDFAIQMSPDHPYVKEHPKWFKWRPDGTVQYAENPPKKYQDVLPINFETEDWKNLWKELKSIVDYWIDKGVKIFRVDNPHTKSFVFWEWLIAEINKEHDDIIFLAEAFTRPRVMEKLGKIGFNQSYTYFTWRNTKKEFEEYLTELTKTKRKEFFRPNFWPNTPDILPVSLENQPETNFIIRAILAATMSSNWGIYGPLFEFGLNEAYPGKEEYTRSEKYEVKHWDWSKTTRIKEVVSSLNKIRKENAALQTTWNIDFAETDNEQIISYIKSDKTGKNQMIFVVSLDPLYSQSGWVNVPLEKLKIQSNEPFLVHDLLTGDSYTWQGERNYVALYPQGVPAHIFKIEKLENLDKQ